MKNLPKISNGVNIFRQLQSQPEQTRKIILWSVIAVIALALLALWVKNLDLRIKSFQGERFIEQLNLPKIEIPAINKKE